MESRQESLNKELRRVPSNRKKKKNKKERKKKDLKTKRRLGKTNVVKRRPRSQETHTGGKEPKKKNHKMIGAKCEHRPKGGEGGCPHRQNSDVCNATRGRVEEIPMTEP